MKKILTYLTNHFGFSDLNDFYTSLIHTNLLQITIPLGLLAAIIEKFFGIYPLTLISFGILILLELVTGLLASRKKGLKIESKKFSRFGLKFGVWVTVFFIVQSLKLQYKDDSEVVYGFYSWLHTFILGYVNMEYLISVLENISVITGKDNNPLVNSLKNKFDKIFGSNE